MCSGILPPYEWCLLSNNISIHMGRILGFFRGKLENSSLVKAFLTLFLWLGVLSRRKPMLNLTVNLQVYICWRHSSDREFRIFYQVLKTSVTNMIQVIHSKAATFPKGDGRFETCRTYAGKYGVFNRKYPIQYLTSYSNIYDSYWMT